MDCNFCPEGNGQALYDAPTTFTGHPMAYLCTWHLAKYGIETSAVRIDAPLTLVGAL
jgi:hypothetical protein